jgi:hypothetical protein
LEHDAFLPIRGEISIKDNTEEEAGDGLSGLEVVVRVPCVLRSVVRELVCWGRFWDMVMRRQFGMLELKRIVGRGKGVGKGGSVKLLCMWIECGYRELVVLRTSGAAVSHYTHSTYQPLPPPHISHQSGGGYRLFHHRLLESLQCRRGLIIRHLHQVISTVSTNPLPSFTQTAQPTS